MRLFVCTIAAGLAAFPAFATCYSEAEANAVRVRAMQTDFMVAALSCDRYGVPEVRQRYTSLVQKFSPEFAQHGHALIGYFQRSGAGGRALDTFITNLANEMAQASNSTPGYCKAILAKMDKALGGKITLAALAPTVGYSASLGPGYCANTPVAAVPKPAPATKPQPPAAAAPAAVPPTAANTNAPLGVTGPAGTDADKGPAHPDASRDIGASPDASRSGFAP